MSNPNDYTQLLDVTALSCPLPLLKTKLALKSLAVGDVLLVRACDAGSWRDIPRYLELSEHQLMSASREGNEYHYWIVKGVKR
ncbi:MULTISPECIES: sulfurtransferase TusA family protein [unclassified Oceanobacter]|uniref:sulfurtransferase TusA family protein n=1 Tax=unclassified Oceanobacter TaxID=2620260 RepID=UPI0026E1C57A|nr:MULTISPECIES: sulfurtransferase TusA family protein [unclassified Oceanobacter]MDO6682778.1 sulfurtransferase TusA family protein [Oceanobacter sp. 5_MG-2023]MDP2504850.1 sulfurtransferase TusA family protein [Oceanobacter sp. 3_MG-2023]MDP2546294.1 sulfurtransferase TusA family protein [Oceanobacter sp. 4_MG-2023]MDP2607595.1 sulfurtransferase TusA family protein [Oceanobacter sp. 1_MG-2023]MDP2610863.1 sulfurtransferase TusA family protein [Oceanobacter sp. 2_MG-2023]